MVLPSIDERGAAADPGPGRRTRGGYAILRGKSRARTHMQAEVPRWGGASSMEDEELSLPTTEEGQAGVAPRNIVG